MSTNFGDGGVTAQERDPTERTEEETQEDKTEKATESSIFGEDNKNDDKDNDQRREKLRHPAMTATMFLLFPPRSAERSSVCT